MTREFDLGDVLTITTGIMLSPRRIDGVYDILNYMTGDNLFTHQLPRAAEECHAPLLAQHPQLADVVVPEFDSATNEDAATAVFLWLAKLEKTLGSRLAVEPLADGEHTRIDPLAEFAMNYPNVTVIPVVIDTEENE